jgi:hypothetical protein
MPASPDGRRENLVRAAYHYGEQAALAYLDGYRDAALTASDLAVENLRKLVEIGVDLPKVLDGLAGTLRNRAEIISVVAPERPPGSRTATLYRQAVQDAEEGIELYRQHGGTNGRPAPLWIASAQFLLAELHVATGLAEPAVLAATAAVADYRRHTNPDEHSQLALAHALSRYANVMMATEAAEAALGARRESVRLYRPWLAPRGYLWQGRLDRSGIWASTPTLRRAIGVALDLADQLEPPDNAAEALAALQDAAEGFAALVTPPLFGVPITVNWLEMADVQQVLLNIAEWLSAIAADEAAAAYRTIAVDMTDAASHTSFANRFAHVQDRVRALRPLLAPYLQ